jgi:hypothetical protein
VTEVRARYATNRAFQAFQGATATHEDLTDAGKGGNVWFGSHLYHHWDLRFITSDVYEESFSANAAALSEFSNSVPAFATPHGYAGDTDLPAKLGARVVFTGTGNQNRASNLPVLDRIVLPPEPSNPHEWWYATHRRRILGRRAS